MLGLLVKLRVALAVPLRAATYFSTFPVKFVALGLVLFATEAVLQRHAFAILVQPVPVVLDAREDELYACLEGLCECSYPKSIEAIQ